MRTHRLLEPRAPKTRGERREKRETRDEGRETRVNEEACPSAFPLPTSVRRRTAPDAVGSAHSSSVGVPRALTCPGSALPRAGRGLTRPVCPQPRLTLTGSLHGKSGDGGNSPFLYRPQRKRAGRSCYGRA